MATNISKLDSSLGFRELSFEYRASRDCQLTFERYCTMYMLYSAWYLACHYLRANFLPHANVCIIFCTYSVQCTSGQKCCKRKHQWVPEEGRLYNYLQRNQDPNWILFSKYPTGFTWFLKRSDASQGRGSYDYQLEKWCRAGTMLFWCFKQLII